MPFKTSKIKLTVLYVLVPFARTKLISHHKLFSSFKSAALILKVNWPEEALVKSQPGSPGYFEISVQVESFCSFAKNET
jgi:hypothetical protein